MQRALTETLLMVAQYETDDPEKREILDELEEQTREIGLLSSDEDADECACNCSCSSGSDLDPDLPTLNDLVATNDADADPDADEPELDPETPGTILEAAAAEAANATDTDGEPSSGSLREYREQQANAADDTDLEDVDGTPSSLSAWRESEAGKQAIEEKEERRPSLMDLLRAP